VARSVTLATLIVLVVAVMALPLDPFWRGLLWVPIGFGMGAVTWSLLFARPFGREPELPQATDLGCEAEFAARDLLRQCEHIRTVLEEAGGHERHRFHLEQARRLGSLVVDLARDRTTVDRLLRELDEEALNYTIKRLDEKCATAEDPEVREAYRAAREARAGQLEMVRQLRSMQEAGEAHWERLTGLIGELAASTALRTVGDRIDSRREALDLLNLRVQRYNAGVAELAAGLGVGLEQH
jgi:hypothetical protein